MFSSPPSIQAWWDSWLVYLSRLVGPVWAGPYSVMSSSTSLGRKRGEPRTQSEKIGWLLLLLLLQKEGKNAKERSRTPWKNKQRHEKKEGLAMKKGRTHHERKEGHAVKELNNIMKELKEPQQKQQQQKQQQQEFKWQMVCDDWLLLSIFQYWCYALGNYVYDESSFQHNQLFIFFFYFYFFFLFRLINLIFKM